MHAVVMDSLEDYLSGLLEPVEIREIEAHLSTCEMCREEVRTMRETSLLFGALRTEEVVEPSHAFCARVMVQLGDLKPAPALAGLFSLDVAFARRLVFASLLTLAVLGSVLVKRESDHPVGISPEAIMAQQNSPGFDSMPARDNMLVTLTAYEH
jgi:anti-sigma factor RsiW